MLNPEGRPVSTAVHRDTIKGALCTTGPKQTVAKKNMLKYKNSNFVEQFNW